MSPTPGRVLFGPAATIRFIPTRKDIAHPIQNNFASLFYRAIAEGGEGAVLVMSSGGHWTRRSAGVASSPVSVTTALPGVLADGRLRDFDDLGGYEFCHLLPG